MKVAGKTRWGSNVRCLKSLLVNKDNLQNLAISRKSVGYLDAQIKSLLLDENTWWEIEQVLGLLTPIFDWITIWEGDDI